MGTSNKGLITVANTCKDPIPHNTRYIPLIVCSKLLHAAVKDFVAASENLNQIL